MKWLLLSLFSLLLGCGGNVVVDLGSGGAGGQGGTIPHGGGHGGGVMTSMATLTPVTSTGPTTNVSASTGGDCNTCGQVLVGASAAQICPGAETDAYNALLGCGCGGGSMCQAQCGGNFCAHQAASNSCQNCMNQVCLDAYAKCTGLAEVSSAVGSTGSGMSCLGCFQFITSGTDLSQLCPDAVGLYNDLATCICSGNCQNACHQTCQTGNTTQGCQNCVFDPDPMGCDDEWNACQAN
jgi:hypothetical protein